MLGNIRILSESIAEEPKEMDSGLFNSEVLVDTLRALLELDG